MQFAAVIADISNVVTLLRTECGKTPTCNNRPYLVTKNISQNCYSSKMRTFSRKIYCDDWRISSPVAYREKNSDICVDGGDRRRMESDVFFAITVAKNGGSPTDRRPQIWGRRGRFSANPFVPPQADCNGMSRLLLLHLSDVR